jgi:membrane protein implicated in regulation of membrane protease activity
MFSKLQSLFKPSLKKSIFYKRLVGKKAKVIEDINPTGKIKIGRSWWIARSCDNDIIIKGECVEIVNVKGFVTFVRR